MTDSPKPKKRQIWREDDPRFKTRYVKVIDVIRYPRTDETIVILQTCNESGTPLSTRTSKANAKRFGKSRGYKFVRNA